MSFWRTFGFHTVSAIDTILDKEEFTLEELLDEEEILQEVKSQNKRLLDFLTQPEIIKVLIEFITVEPPEGEEESKRKYKYPFLACEILSSGVWVICDAVYKDEELVHSLYSFLEQEAPLNHQLANYVCRAAADLLQRKITETVEYMKSRNMIQHFIKHLNNASVMDLLLKVISCEETSEGSGILDWLCETDLIPCLVSKFSADNTAEVHENAAQALVDIISVSGGVASSPLIRQLESEPIVKTLFDAILQQPASSSALLHGLTVAIELLARSAAENTAREEAAMINATIEQKADTTAAALPPPIAPEATAAATDATADGDKAAADAASADKPATDDAPAADAQQTPTKDDAAEAPKDAVAAPAVDATATTTSALPPLLSQTLSRLDAFAKLLVSNPGPSRVMSSGESLEAFGFEKLKILEFFAMVVRLNCAPIDAELMRLNFFAIAMDAFFKYTWNNFLHATVEQIVAGVLEGDNAQLQLSLVQQTNLPKLLVEANARNNAELEKPRGVRRGYMGHVTAIAVRLLQTAARSTALAVLLEGNSEWCAYAQGDLADVRAAETKPLGGHRPMGGPGESSDEDEEELDDDGDSIFDRYQLGFSNEEFGDEDGDGDMHFDDDYDDGRGGFEMYEDGSDESGDGEWPRDGEAEGSDDVADDVEAVVAVVEAAVAAEVAVEVAADAEVAGAATTPAADDTAEPAKADAAEVVADTEAAKEDSKADDAKDEPAADAKDEPAADVKAADAKDEPAADAKDEPAAATDEPAAAKDAAADDEGEKPSGGEDADDDELKAAFGELDKDGSGKLSRAEIEGLMASMDQFDTPDKIEAALKSVDADGDGQISLDEFIKLARSAHD